MSPDVAQHPRGVRTGVSTLSFFSNSGFSFSSIRLRLYPEVLRKFALWWLLLFFF